MRRCILCLAGFCVLLWFFWGCSMEENEPQVLDPVLNKAEFLIGEVVSDTEINFKFSSPVKVTLLFFNPNLEVESVEDGSTVKVCLEEDLEPDMVLMAGLFAEDEWGNGLSVVIPLETGKNIHNPEQPDSDPEATQFLVCNVISETEIEFVFSSPIELKDLSFNRIFDFESDVDSNIVKVTLDEGLAPGTRIEAELLAEDEWGNELNVLVPFYSRNSRVPKLLINELRTEYSKPKGEFIEFKMGTDGNLGALRVFAAGNNKNPMIYEFPSVEVKEGEYVVLHLRTWETHLDELGENLDESSGTDSSSLARDLWISGSSELLRKTDAIYVLDQDDNILDAIMISDSPLLVWEKNYLAEAAEFLFISDAWKSESGTVCKPVDEVSSAKINTSYAKSISRYETAEDTNTAFDWYISAIATPGLKN